MEHHLLAFDNAHTPSSKQRKKNTMRDKNKPRFPGKPPGGNGGGIKLPPPDKVVEHILEFDPISGQKLGDSIGYWLSQENNREGKVDVKRYCCLPRSNTKREGN